MGPDFLHVCRYRAFVAADMAACCLDEGPATCGCDVWLLIVHHMRCGRAGQIMSERRLHMQDVSKLKAGEVDVRENGDQGSGALRLD